MTDTPYVHASAKKQGKEGNLTQLCESFRGFQRAQLRAWAEYSTNFFPIIPLIRVFDDLSSKLSGEEIRTSPLPLPLVKVHAKEGRLGAL